MSANQSKYTAEQASQALGELEGWIHDGDGGHISSSAEVLAGFIEQQAALLRERESVEAVAWMRPRTAIHDSTFVTAEDKSAAEEEGSGMLIGYTIPLYTHPAPAVSVPDSWVEHGDAALSHISNALEDLESSPDQRPVSQLHEAMYFVRAMLAAAPPARTGDAGVGSAPQKQRNDGNGPCFGYGVNANGQAECYWPDCKCAAPTGNADSRDAARYRWLRRECYKFPSDASVNGNHQTEDVAIWSKPWIGDTYESIDAAIDAAVASQEKGDG